MEQQHIIFWQICWFFQMEPDLQIGLIGQTEEQWFIEENASNLGANYIKGVCLSFLECNTPDYELAFRLRAAVAALCDNFEPAFWSFPKLSASAKWQDIRSLAAALIEEASPLVRPPKRPFKIEELIHVDHYLHASKVRAHFEKSKGGKKSRKHKNSRVADDADDA